MCIHLFKKKRQVFVPTALQRLEEFFVFCEDLDAHPFFVAHKNGGGFQLTCDFPESGEDSAVLNFDEYHLESLLTRLRQFFFCNELFFFKDLRRDTIKAFGTSKVFDVFYDKLCKAIKQPFPKSQVQALKSDGTDIIANYTLPQLIEARLYTGAIHSTKRIDPAAQAVIKGISNAHIAVSKHLSIVLASASMKAVQNILCFRYHIYLLAKADGKQTLFEELNHFHQRVVESQKVKP
jgi:hypothetical protein